MQNDLTKCAQCRSARASPSGKVACLLFTEGDLRAIAGRRLRTDAEKLIYMNQVLTGDFPLYRGWGYLNQPYSNKPSSDGKVLTANCYLLPPDASCRHAAP